MKTASIGELQAAYNNSENKLRKALQKAYPLDSIWLVRIRIGQKYPCSMKVIGHEPGWKSCIRFEKPGKPKPFGYGKTKACRRSVPLENIIA